MAIKRSIRARDKVLEHTHLSCGLFWIIPHGRSLPLFHEAELCRAGANRPARVRETPRPSFWAEPNVGGRRGEAFRSGPPDCSHGDTLDDVAGNAFLSPVVELGRLGVGVAGQVLDVLEGHVLGKQVGHDEDAKAVGAEDMRQPGIFEPSFEHTAHSVRRQGPGGECLLFSPGGPKQGRFLGVGRDAGRLQIRHEPAVEVVADGDLALLSSLFPEPQDALGALVLEVAAAEPGEGADPGPGVGEGSEEGAVAEADDVGEVEGGEEVAGLLDGEFGGLAVDHGVLLAPHGGERVQRHGMASHQGIEEMAQGGQGLVLGGAIAGEVVKEAAGAAGGDLAKREVLVLAPGEEAANEAGVGAAGMGVRDTGGEELIGGEQGVFPGPLEDGGSGVGDIEGVGRRPEGGW